MKVKSFITDVRGEKTQRSGPRTAEKSREVSAAEFMPGRYTLGRVAMVLLGQESAAATGGGLPSGGGQEKGRKKKKPYLSKKRRREDILRKGDWSALLRKGGNTCKGTECLASRPQKVERKEGRIIVKGGRERSGTSQAPLDA